MNQETFSIENNKINKREQPNNWVTLSNKKFITNYGKLIISNISDTSFNFEIIASNGANIKYLEEVALITENNVGIFKEEDCTLTFKLLSGSKIKVQQKVGSCGAGIGVSFEGKNLNIIPLFL